MVDGNVSYFETCLMFIITVYHYEVVIITKGQEKKEKKGIDQKNGSVKN